MRMKSWKGKHSVMTVGLSVSKPVFGCCLVLFTLLLAACSPPVSNLVLNTPSQTVEAASDILQLTPRASSANPPTEMPGDASPTGQADLPDLGPAPELLNEVWLNTDQALRLADLGGKVVLLDMWTFG